MEAQLFEQAVGGVIHLLIEYQGLSLRYRAMVRSMALDLLHTAGNLTTRVRREALSPNES